ncbi:MAG: hypothetical protein U5K29_15410 [Acidimicrobiales bacterium]|nr:hypothetical protein [Acidimicrobiales bacterium]
MTHETDETRDVLRAVWAAQGEVALPVDEDCSPTKQCKNTREITFDGLAEPGTDLGEAWRDRLAREGKLNTSGGTVGDLVFGQSDSR